MAKRFAVSTIFKVNDQFSAPVDKMSKKVDNFARKAEKKFTLAPAFKSLKRLKTVAIAATAAVGGLALKIGKISKPFADFEKTFSVTMGALPQQIKKGTDEYRNLQQTIRSIAIREGFLPEDVLGGFKDIVLATNDVDFSIKALSTTTQFARVNSLNLKDAMKILRMSIVDFGEMTDDSNKNLEIIRRNMDALTFSAKTGGTSMHELGIIVGRVGGLMAQTGTPFLEALTISRRLAIGGIKGAEAATAQRQLITAFTAPGSAENKAIRDAFIQMSDPTTGRATTLLQRIEQFFQGMKSIGLRGNELNEIATKFFGPAAINAALTLHEFNEEMQVTLDQMSKFEDFTKGISDQLKGELAFAMAANNAAWGDLKLAIGEAVAPDVIEILNSVSAFFKENKEEIVETARIMVKSILLVGRGLAPMVRFIHTIMSNLLEKIRKVVDFLKSGKSFVENIFSFILPGKTTTELASTLALPPTESATTAPTNSINGTITVNDNTSSNSDVPELNFDFPGLKVAKTGGF